MSVAEGAGKLKCPRLVSVSAIVGPAFFVLRNSATDIALVSGKLKNSLILRRDSPFVRGTLVVLPRGHLGRHERRGGARWWGQKEWGPPFCGEKMIRPKNLAHARCFLPFSRRFFGAHKTGWNGLFLPWEKIFFVGKTKFLGSLNGKKNG